MKLSLLVLAGVFFLTPATLLAETHDNATKVETRIVEPVNINTASAEEIAGTLTGIGLAKAKAIVDYRKEFGPFDSIDDLVEVKGVGIATIEKNRSRMTVK